MQGSTLIGRMQVDTMGRILHVAPIDANSNVRYREQLSYALAGSSPAILHIFARCGGMANTTVIQNASSFGVVANQQTRLLCKQESNEGSTRRLHQNCENMY